MTVNTNQTSTPHKPTKIHWFRHDLRVQDNQALYDLCQDNDCNILAIFIFDPNWLVENNYGSKPLGAFRHAFLDQSLIELKQSLERLNIPLLCLHGAPAETMQSVLTDTQATALSVEFHAGLYERRQVEDIRLRLPNVDIKEAYSNSLFSPKQLPFSLDDMPNVFSPFRRKIEKGFEVFLTCLPIVKRESLAAFNLSQYEVYIPAQRDMANGYHGGQSEAIKRIDDYFFESHGIASYKETRNGLDGWDFSSRLSAFLANGCISPRYVYERIKDYEHRIEANDSTYWLFFELLWREFFHWQACKQDAKFFRFLGIQGDKVLNNKHNDSLFEKWKTGDTGYAIVDACMRQLAQTGWMSNRGRQLVASCFVHELNLDWRYGAAYFEEQLVDFDVASNYGNWQYLAGVGSDPRGHRQFNLEKQTQIYDPNKVFINKWT